MSERAPHRRAFGLGSTILTFALGCAGSRTEAPVDPVASEPLASVPMSSGKICFVGAQGEPMANAEVFMRSPLGALDDGRQTSDGQGCVLLAGFSEGYYQPLARGVMGISAAYVSDGDHLNAHVQGMRFEISQADPKSLSATLTVLADRYEVSDADLSARIKHALTSPDGSTLRLAGLLASFSIDGYLGEESTFRPNSQSKADAEELLDRLSPASPLLTAWPTAPVGAALVLGRVPLELPLVETIVARHPDPGVGSSTLLLELARADRAGDIDNARRIHRRISFGRFDQTSAWETANINFKHLRAGPQFGDPVPRLSVRDVDGRQQRIVAQNRPTLVYFWSSYCRPCESGPAQLRALSERFGARLQIVSVSIDEESAPASAFREQHGGMPGLVVDGADNPGLAQDLGVLGVPEVFLFDEGETRVRGSKLSEVEQALAQALAQD